MRHPSQRPHPTRLVLPVAALVGALGAARGATAQVVLDGSLGAGGARIGPNYVIPSSVGQLRGTNLFHSFSQFNINTGESATFTAPSDVPVTNVIARVTGGQSSNVNGLLRCAIPQANLYLVNPAGVVFGPDAQLDVQGAFAVSTASYLRFADGAKFSATSASDVTLSTASPVAFGFLGPSVATARAKPQAASGSTAANNSNAAGAITYDTSAGSVTGQPPGLSVATGQSLSIVGRSVRIVGGRIQALGGQVNVVAAGASGEVKLDGAQPSAVPDVSGAPALGAVELAGGASLRAPVGGRVVVRGGTLTLDRSSINVDTDTVAGNGIDIAVSGAMTMQNGSVSAETLGPADSGAIRIAAGSLAVTGLFTDGTAPIVANTANTGRGGDILVTTAGAVTIVKEASLSAVTNAPGRSGDITLNAKSLTIDGTGAAFLTGLAAETTLLQGGGAGGDITLNVGAMQIKNAGQISATTKGSGAAGSVLIHAKSFLIDGMDAPFTGIEARVGNGADFSGATGAGGRVAIDADTVRLIRGGVVTASTFGGGQGGSVNVSATSIDLEGSKQSQFTGFFSRSAPVANNRAPGGDVTLSADRIHIGPFARASAESTNGVNAGKVTLTGGSVSIDRGSVTVAAPDTAAGGNLTITGRQQVLVNGGQVTAQAGTGGNATISSPVLVDLKNAKVLTRAAVGNGGSITIDPATVILNHSRISADAAINGGNITIRPPVLLTAATTITATGLAGVNGTIAVTSPNNQLAGSLVPLSGALVGTEAALVPACGVRLGGRISSFVVTGRGGTPAEPGGWSADWILAPGVVLP